MFKEQQKGCMSWMLGVMERVMGDELKECEKRGGRGPNLVGPWSPIRTLAFFSKGGGSFWRVLSRGVVLSGSQFSKIALY